VAKPAKNRKKKKKLTPRHRKFIDFYINSGNATDAYRRAGYNGKGSDRSAYNLLRKPEIIEEIEKKRKEIAEKSGITAKMVIDEIAKIAFSNSEDFFEWGVEQVELIPDSGIIIERGVAILRTPEQLTRDHKACIQSIEQTQHGIKLKLYSKDKALESLKKYFGLDSEEEIRKAIAIRKGESKYDTNKDTIDALIEKRMKKLKGD
jgi:phage terminase small subunit